MGKVKVKGVQGKKNTKKLACKVKLKDPLAIKHRRKHKWKQVRDKKEKRERKEGKDKPPQLSKSQFPQSEDKKESLRERMLKRLQAARFRQINQDLDSKKKTEDAKQAFDKDPELFKKYHQAYRERVEHWPKNPLDVIIKWVKKMKGDKIIADFGCGEAKLSTSVPNKVHSFDLFALNDRVTACDMSNVPLSKNSVDAAVFCLSLMGTDVSKFILEANRVLKMNGVLKIAEVASRFNGKTYSNFLKRMKKYGFIATHTGQRSSSLNEGEGDDVFLMFEFKKTGSISEGMLARLPALKLNPSVYKRR